MYKIKALALILSLFVIFVTACSEQDESVTVEIIKPVHVPADADHVWVVDQNGEYTPVAGAWEATTVSREDMQEIVGFVLVLPLKKVSVVEQSRGIYVDNSGISWTKGTVLTGDGAHLVFLERVDTSVEPNVRYQIYNLNKNGDVVNEFPVEPLNNPLYNHIAWVKK